MKNFCLVSVLLLFSPTAIAASNRYKCDQPGVQALTVPGVKVKEGDPGKEQEVEFTCAWVLRCGKQSAYFLDLVPMEGSSKRYDACRKQQPKVQGGAWQNCVGFGGQMESWKAYQCARYAPGQTLPDICARLVLRRKFLDDCTWISDTYRITDMPGFRREPVGPSVR